MKIWIVEDNKLHAQMIISAFSSDAALRVFENGSSLLEQLASNPDRPDVVVLDWRLPDMAGLDVCRFLRTTHDEISLPVLILTSQDDKHMVVEGLKAGANDYLTKPFDAAELRARVATLFRIKTLDQARVSAEQERQHYQQLVLGMVGHDLRTPLSAVTTGLGVLMESTDMSDAHQRMLGRMKNSATRMGRMIEQIVDFTRSRFGGLDVHKVECDAGSVFDQCIEEFALVGGDSKLVAKIEKVGPVHWDPDRVVQALGNLLANARSHGSQTEPITLDAKREAENIVVDVHNFGPVIAQRVIDKIFDPFRRAGESRSVEASKGLGLGLYIARQIIEAHGGTIDVLSTSQKGTSFRTTLPIRKTHA